VLGAIALAVTVDVPMARADTFGAQVHHVTGTTYVHGLELDVAPTVKEPEVLVGRHPHLWGYGRIEGAGLRGDVLVDSTRLGLGVSYYGVSDVSVATDALPPGLATRPASIWGSTVELFVGQEIGQGPIYPYVDLAGSFSILQVDLETHAEPYGHVGTTYYNAWRFGVGPRFGMLIPVGHSTMIDLAVHQRLFGGVTQTTLSVGLGYWENDRTDPFSQKLRGDHFRGEF
jgi:hypothetical protein